MSPQASTRQAVILAVVAGGLARLLIGDAFQSYVRPSMFLPLLVSALAIGGLALWTVLAYDDEDDLDAPPADGETIALHDRPAEADDAGHDHDHRGVPRIGWWLVVPVICIAVVPLRPLGASSVRDGGGNEATVERIADRQGTATGTDAVDGPVDEEVPDTLLDFISRVVDEPDRPIAEPVTLTGFVLTSGPDEFVLARFVMSCCAADAQPLLITVRWSGEVPANDDWVTVTGTQVPARPDTPPEERPNVENIILEATSVEEIPEPSAPYETF